MYGIPNIPIDKEYTLSPSFATLVFLTITLAIRYDAYYVTYISIRSLFGARLHSYLVCKTTYIMCRCHNVQVASQKDNQTE